MAENILSGIGKWSAEYGADGSCTKAVYDETYLRMLGLEASADANDSADDWIAEVHPDDIEKIEANAKDLFARHPEGMDYDLEYRMLTPAGYHWFHDYGIATRREDGTLARLDGVIFDIQDIVEKEEAQKKLTENYLRILALSDDFEVLYDVELDTGRYDIFVKGQSFGEVNRSLINTNSFYEDVEKNLDVVHPDDRQGNYDTTRPEFIRGALSKEDHFDRYYRLMVDGKPAWARMRFVWKDAERKNVIIGVFNAENDPGRLKYAQKLGAVPLSADILDKANIGLWAFELDEGQPPRMYDDRTMLGLVGLDREVSPEEAYHAWYDNIDEGSYDLVHDAVAKMSAGEHAEVQYPWHFPDGRTIIVRCGGVRNFEYTKGIRIEGTHQDVTQTLHYDEKERERAKQVEDDLIVSKLRADSLAYIEDNEPDLDRALEFFGKRILEISGCDQVVYRETDGRRTVFNAPGIEDVPQEICAECPFARLDREIFGEDGNVLMNDSAEGCRGVFAPESCPAKSAFMQLVYSGGELAGKLTVHYLKEKHTFTDNGIRVLKMISSYLGLLIERIKAKQADLARIQAESASRAKTEFLFNMSHDIRTPMNAILGYTDIALNHISEQNRVQDSLNKIKTSGGHLLSLINDILEMSRIEAGKMELVIAPLNAYEVTEGISNMSQALAASKDIDFSAVIGNMKNPYVYADELHTNQVLINLISNAIKYTQAGGRVEYTVEQTADPDGEGFAKYRLTVKDNGIGMSEEFQQHLFESFSREESATVSGQEGSGLGLAIVKRILDLIGGTIAVESRKGAGSTFTVDLPLRVLTDEEIEEFEAKRMQQVEEGLNAGFAGRRVLLVEDNAMNRDIATDILEDDGLLVETAADGSIAVDLLRDKGPDYYDFILMDIQMPVMNGYEATKEIRRMYPEAGIKIIALSANAFAEDRAASIAAGMDDHVAKPINTKELFSVMAKYL